MRGPLYTTSLSGTPPGLPLFSVGVHRLGPLQDVRRTQQPRSGVRSRVVPGQAAGVEEGVPNLRQLWECQAVWKGKRGEAFRDCPCIFVSLLAGLRALKLGWQPFTLSTWNWRVEKLETCG